MIAESSAYHCLGIEMIDRKSLKNSFIIAKSHLQRLIRSEIYQLIGKPLKLFKALKCHGASIQKLREVFKEQIHSQKGESHRSKLKVLQKIIQASIILISSKDRKYPLILNLRLVIQDLSCQKIFFNRQSIGELCTHALLQKQLQASITWQN